MSYNNYVRALGTLSTKHLPNMRNLMKETANLRRKKPHSGQKSTKMKTHQRPLIFYAPISRCLTSILEPLIAIRNYYMFLQMVEKKDTNSPSRKQRKIVTHNSRFFTKVEFRCFFLSYSQNITFVGTSHSLKKRPRISLSRNPNHSNV